VINLSWSGAAGTNVDVYRDGSVVVTTTNDGAYSDATGLKGGRSYTHKVCEEGSVTACSDEVVTVF